MSSASFCRAYSGESPLAPRPRRSIAQAVKRDENMGIIGVQRVRSPIPPWTMIRLGPSPAHSIAMSVPSFDGTWMIWVPWPGRELAESPSAATTKSTTNDAERNILGRELMARRLGVALSPQRRSSSEVPYQLVVQGVTASMKRPAPQVPFTDPDDLVSLEYSRSEAHRLDPSAMKRPAPQVPFTDPDDLVSLEYSRSEA